MVNTTYDVVAYEQYDCEREIYDGNVIYESFLRAKKNSDWKASVQRFEMTYLLQLADIQKRLKNGSYEFTKGKEFVLRERGKERPITGEIIRDRIVKHAICDEVLTPTLRPYLIYDNGASLKGKGIDFTRRRLETHLHKYYRHHGSNDGYILLMDYSKYYDNIRHDKLIELYEKYIDDELVLHYIQKIVDSAKVDVSYMSDEEYKNCMDVLFNSLEYRQTINQSMLTGDRYMYKHLNVGDQTAQDAGILYPTPIDNYIKIVKGEKYYARYMDDSYVIHESKEHLIELLKDITEYAKQYGIAINLHKTQICKLSELWRFLQIQYSLTDTGRVIHKINPKRLVTMRRKMKKLAPKMQPNDFKIFFNSWFCAHKRYISKRQKQNMINLYNQLSKEVYKNV